MSLDSGVASYVKCEAKINVSFPVDHNGREYIACKYCSYYKEYSLRCALNGEICEFPERYVGSHCPLEIIEEEEEK